MNLPLVLSVSTENGVTKTLLEEFGSRLIISEHLATALNEAAGRNDLGVQMRWERFVKAIWPRLGKAQRLHVNAHCQAVAMMASYMASEASLEPQTAARLHTAGLLHDVGKCFIPDELLSKPGKLTSEQWEIMNLHSSASGWIAQKLGADDETVSMVLDHHKSYDSNSSDSCCATRMLTVADAYVTMCSDRSYSAAMPPSQALAELDRCSNTQFDPSVVSIMHKVCKRAA